MLNAMQAGVVVIGAGHAACQFAASLRQLGWKGALTLVGADAHLPYHRPPLSKACLQGGVALTDILLRPAAFYRSIDCTLLAGRAAVAIDPRRKLVRLDGGDDLPYAHLVLATGAAARAWPGLPVGERVHVLRTWDDAQALGAALGRIHRLAVLGAGYVGLEVAAAARKRGVAVDVFEAAPRVLQRSVSEATSAQVESLHRAQGVALHIGTAITSVRAEGSAVELETSVGCFAADALVIGIGAHPRVELARDAGLQCGQAIRVDAQCRTTAEDVFAIGDCAEQVLQPGAEPVRLESVQNATDQARCAAAVIAGRPLPPTPVPWFWSDQFDHRIQVAGRVASGDAAVTRPQRGKAHAHAVWYVRDGRVTAVETIDAPEDFMAARQLIKTGQRVDIARLADPEVALRSLAAAAH
jgi:3-phenylpropionate/trans-cinnamate dioxygenase ferredoxin reductase subunit